MFLPVHSWSKRLAYLTSVFPKSKSDACLQAGFLPGRVLTPFSDFFFSVSPSWMVGCGRVRHMASSWACAETNTVAGCSCRLPSSYGFSDVLSHHLYAHFISCFFVFFFGVGVWGRKALNLLQEEILCRSPCDLRSFYGEMVLGLHKVLYFQSCYFMLSILNTMFVSFPFSLDSFTALEVSI